MTELGHWNSMRKKIAQLGVKKIIGAMKVLFQVKNMTTQKQWFSKTPIPTAKEEVYDVIKGVDVFYESLLQTS